MNQDDWIEAYKQRNAYWVHDGNPKRPHVRLHKGGHSDGFFNSELVMENPHLLYLAVTDLVKLITEQSREVPNRIVGPAMGAITLAHELAHQITFGGDITRRVATQCLRAYTEKETDQNGNPIMVFKKTSVGIGEVVLLCEDVITTGDSISLTEEAVLRASGVVMPFVVALVNRSGLTEIDGKRIISLVDKRMDNWSSEECPLCKVGSEALYPAKELSNWRRLNAEY